MKTLNQFLDERLGGKGYKPYTSLTGKKVSGDWEDSDRGAGNKAKKRAGGKVEKKSPTYRAHVLNKEDYETKKTGEVLAAFKRDPKVRKRFEKAAKKEGGPGSAKNRAADDMLQTAKDTAKRKGDTSKSDDRYAYESVGGGVPLTPQELEIQKKMSRLNVRLARKRSQEMQKAKIKDTETAPEQVKEGNKVLFPLGDVHSGESKKKILVWKKNKKGSSEQVKEAKVDKGRSDYGKATIRNYRRSGPGHGEPAMFDPENKRGKTIDKRREEHKARRGVKKAKVPAYKVNEEDKAFNFVVNKLKAKYGSGVMTKGDKMPEPSAAQKKKNAAIRAKRAKEDHRDPTEKASDGRYSDRYSNRGSD